jgi:hypothetical protein
MVSLHSKSSTISRFQKATDIVMIMHKANVLGMFQPLQYAVGHLNSKMQSNSIIKQAELAAMQWHCKQAQVYSIFDPA